VLELVARFLLGRFVEGAWPFPLELFLPLSISRVRLGIELPSIVVLDNIYKASRSGQLAEDFL
jgi:hypothetical protein